MKKSIILFALVLSLTSTVFASNKGDKKEKAEKPTRELTLEEKALKEKLTSELEVSLNEILQTTETKVEKVIVYNLKGEVVQIQDSNIDFDHLPKGASLFMKEGNTQYYMLF